MSAYSAPLWLPGGHLQTIYPVLFARAPRVHYRRTRWDTPDGDFIDLDWVQEQDTQTRIQESGFRIQDSGARIQESGFRSQDSGARIQESGRSPLLVLFHGLEGSSHSHYARALMYAAAQRGWSGVVVHFRGCSGEPNRLPRAYHSGDSQEIDWVVRRLQHVHSVSQLFAVGVSLGGNALLKWLGERGASACALLAGAAAVSAPLDLMAAGNALDAGFNRLYVRHFLATLKPKTQEQLLRFPGLVDAQRMSTARTLREFDDAVTAPLHGFRNTDDYWTRASSKPLLRHIRVPTLLINARNDPFLPARALPAAGEVAAQVVLEFPESGGHVGFVTGAFPGKLSWLPQRVLQFFDHCVEVR